MIIDPTALLRFPLKEGATRVCCLLLIGGMFLAGPARSSPTAAKRTVGQTPIRIINTNAGRVMSASAKQYAGKVYISGLVYRPPSPTIGPHVHVWGLDDKKKTVFLKTTFIMVTGKPSFIQSEPYVISVSPAIFAKAQVIYVTFHSQSNAQAEESE